MPAKYLDYYTRVADRIVPFLQGRQVAIEQRFPGSRDLVYRRQIAQEQAQKAPVKMLIGSSAASLHARCRDLAEVENGRRWTDRPGI